MSTFCNLLNNSFPAPVLDVDASDMNVSDANNYIFDLSQVVADDTFEITAASLRGKRTTVAIVGDSGVTNTTKYIGCVPPGGASDGSNGSSTFKFYKFLAFKEKLTKEQINLAIERYFN